MEWDECRNTEWDGGVAGSHPRATFREMETEVDKRLAELRARMFSDAAMLSAEERWPEGGEAVVCASCGAELEKKGVSSGNCKCEAGGKWRLLFEQFSH